MLWHMASNSLIESALKGHENYSKSGPSELERKMATKMFFSVFMGWVASATFLKVRAKCFRTWKRVKLPTLVILKSNFNDTPNANS